MKVFAKDYIPNGYRMVSTYKIIPVESGDAVVFKTKVIDKEGVVVSNGFALEEKNISDFNRVNFFATAQTRSRSSALAGLGIGIEEALPTQEDIDTSKRSMTVAKEVGVIDTLAMLKLKYEQQEDGTLKVLSKRVPKKSAEVLKRFGFIKNEDGLFVTKEEVKDERPKL
jgi:hypothetical protein